MALKKTPVRQQRRAPVDEDDDDDEDLLEQQHAAAAETDLDEELQALDAELGADASTAKIVVHKVVPNGDSQRCFSCPRPQFFSDEIREKWGAGTYSIMVYFRGKLRQRHRLTFAEPIRAAPPAPASVASDESAGLRDLRERMDREQERFFKLLEMFAGGGARAQIDPLQMQQQTLSMLTTVQQLVAPKESGSDRTPIELFLEGVKMAQKLGGGESTDWGAVALTVAESLKAMSSSPAPARAAIPAVPSPPPRPPAASTAVAPPDGDSNMLEQLRKQLQFLVRKAAQGSDATLYADLAIDNLGELPQLVQSLAIDYLQRPDCLERLIQLEPAIAQHREWFATLAGEIRRQISPENASSPLTGEEGPGEAGDH